MEIKISKLDELQTFKSELVQYSNSVYRYLEDGLTEKEEKQGSELYNTISKKVGYLGSFISELSEIANVDVHGKEYDMWLIALKMPTDKFADSALGVCLLATNKAIGKLEDDIEKGIRDKQGNLIEKPQRIDSEPPKAFIAHGGDSPALRKLKSYLDALGVQPLIVEEQPSEGRSIAENVDYYARQSDFAIILATKGDIDGKTGGFIPRGNVSMEIGKLQEILKDRIVYLAQAGTKLPTNISEKVRERFASQSMDNAFIKVAKELKKCGILRAVKPQD